MSEIVPKASSERSRKTLKSKVSGSELIGLGSFCARGDIKKKGRRCARLRSRGCSVSRRRAMMMKNKEKVLRSFRRRRRNDRGRQKTTRCVSELIGLSVFVSRISERYKKKKKVRGVCALAVLRFLGIER